MEIENNPFIDSKATTLEEELFFLNCVIKFYCRIRKILQEGYCKLYVEILYIQLGAIIDEYRKI